MSISRHVFTVGNKSILSRVLYSHSVQSVRCKFRAVIFDMGGVVLPSPFPMTKEYESVKNIPAGTIWKAIKDYGEKGAWPKLEIGVLNSARFGEVFSEECTITAGRPIDVKDFLQYLEDGMKSPIPEVLDAVDCLRQYGYKTALLTNNWKTASGETLLPFEKNRFDVVIESALAGVNKPNYPIYNLCLNKLQVKPEESIFLDDMQPNLTAAKSLGIYCIKVEDAYVAINELEELLKIPLNSTRKGTKSVKKDMEIPLKSLTKYLNDKLSLNLTHEPEIRQFSHGQSNPTYLIDPGPHKKKLVLRKKPPGKLLPSAHAVEREYRVMDALGKHGVPVPPLLDLCEDSSIIGTPFYVMEFVEGNTYTNPSLPGMSPAMRSQIYDRMMETLCAIHQVDIDRAGLSNYGKIGNYVQRQVSTWSKQYNASETHNIPSMDRLMEWLPIHIPQNETTSVVHGDFRVDNLIYRRDRPEVLAVLDWELSTLGDPISDLAYCCLPYSLPQHFPILAGLKGVNIHELGIPSQDELVSKYCREMGIESIDNFDFYMAFSFFRVAAILQGVYKRSTQGQASSHKASQAGKLAESMADIGWTFASKEGFRLFNKVNPNPLQDVPGVPSGSKRSYSTRAYQGLLPIHIKSLRDEVQELHPKLLAFMDDHIYPSEEKFRDHYQSQHRWTPHPDLEDIKNKAKDAGLWNLFLPPGDHSEEHYGAGLTNTEYTYLCEIMGRSLYAPEVFNCSAPDTGNMEVLAQFGTTEQKQKWLEPLLDGEIRSCFAMTEPDVASSDASNITSEIRSDGDEYVINGRKWWTSGALDPRMKVIIFMGKTDVGAPRHKQQSMVIVPAHTPGIKILRPLSVFGFDDAPVGHGELIFDDVRVPKDNVILAPGAGFQIAQARLGPGRIHHCMRLIGSAERCLDLMKERIKTRVTFGRPLVERDTILRDIATSRIEIEQSRLLVLKTAHMMDTVGNKEARKEIAMIKIAVPQTVSRVIDRSMQAFGAAGLCGDFPMAGFYAWSRALRIADGPDEVHERTLAKLELTK
ncbi:acyl-CoA dehydrogenase family member 10-like isoform X1 [Clavelina lepadiformis]|uniref:acyl-CoA dehydrogenase family member 10-like isoform X1 n=2 Tax=Clavelina lepadiformis TaxID=159417 RepID=UPI004040EB79